MAELPEGQGVEEEAKGFHDRRGRCCACVMCTCSCLTWPLHGCVSVQSGLTSGSSMHGDGNVSVPVLLGFIDAHLHVAT